MRARWTSQPNALNCGALRTLASSPAVFLAKSVCSRGCTARHVAPAGGDPAARIIVREV